MKFRCAHCGRVADRPAGHVNRQRARGQKLYCGRRCMGLDRRQHKPKAQRIAEKRAYDMEYRRKNRATLKAKKAAYHKATYDPKQAAIARKKRMPYHVKYCQRPSYKAWKREYDFRYRAKKFGPFAEAYMMTIELNREIKSRSSNYEIRQQNRIGQKAQRRAREAQEGGRSRRHSAAVGA